MSPHCQQPTSLCHLQRHRMAFTLIELLVVIAIIGILAAILFPVFAQAKAAAKKALCISNLKQDSLAIVLYAGDYDDTSVTQLSYLQNGTYEFWPCGFPANFTSTTLCDETTGLLYPYIKNTGVWECPVTGAFDGPPLPLTNAVLTYGMNQPTPFLSAYDSPADSILFADVSTLSTANGTFHRGLNLAPPNGSATSTPNTLGIHSGFASVGWYDGHAKAMHVSIRPSAYYTGFGKSNPTVWEQNNLGEILGPGVSYPITDPIAAKYYFCANKTTCAP